MSRVGIVTVSAAVMLAVISIIVSGCTSANAPGNLPPIFPAENQPPEAKVDPVTRTVSVTKSGVTVSAQYWRQYDLDRRFNVGTMTSPFYYKASWKQSEKVDVFYVTIENNSQRDVRVEINEFFMSDNRDTRYLFCDYNFLEQRLRSRSMMDISVKNGLQKARQELLETRLPKGNIIKPGEKVEGFVPFTMSTLRAKQIFVNVKLTIMPDTPAGRQTPLDIVLNFAHDTAIREAQPATVRF